MSYKIFPTHRFEKEIKRLSKKYPSLRKEYAELISLLEQDPETGISIGNRCYKIRIAIASKGRGKSVGARVITYVYVLTETIYLLTIYDKSEKSDVLENELREMISEISF
ncbi:MAG: hypothetical protein HYR67_13020 [Bacteroidetes bacterium]|nr:hypothetical protein [Bacteroidota bacterium]